MNDEFKILGKFVEQASVWVYNRWGVLLFHSTDKDKGWDGTYLGDPVATGVYTYRAQFVTADGKKSQDTGSLFLTR